MDRPNRSYPNLGPLTTLPASPSYLYPTTSIPSTPSLLSRPSSQTRLRPTRSAPTAVAPGPTLQNPALKKKRSIRHAHGAEDDDWVTRTASTLTLTTLEEKGQAWLAARRSSTSLTGGEAGGEEDEPYEPEWSRSRVLQSARGSSARLQGRSRVQSRVQSRAQSRARSRIGSVGEGGGGGDGVREEEIGPDFVDVEEEEDGEGEEGEEVDEGEMKRVVMGRVDGWVDWAVGWMDFRGEGEEEGDADEADGAAKEEDDGEARIKGELDPVELQKRLRRKKKKDDEAETGTEGTDTVSSAPEQSGVWSDAKWLLSVASRVAL